MDRNTEITNSQQSIEFSENTNSMDNTLVDEGNSEAVSKLRLAQNVKMMKDEIELFCPVIRMYMTPEQINQMCQMLMEDMQEEPLEEIQRTMKNVLRRTDKTLLKEHFTLVDPNKTEEDKEEAREMMETIIDEVTLPEWGLMIKQTAMECNPARAKTEMTLQYLLDQGLHYSTMEYNLQERYNSLDQARMEVMEMIMDEYRYY